MPRCVKVGYERGGGLVDVFAALRQVFGQLAVMVPIAMVELDETDAALGQAAREQAVGGESAGLLRVVSVELEGVGGFFREISQFGHRALHAERHLVLRNAGADFRDRRIHRRRSG